MKRLILLATGALALPGDHGGARRGRRHRDIRVERRLPRVE